MVKLTFDDVRQEINDHYGIILGYYDEYPATLNADADDSHTKEKMIEIEWAMRSAQELLPPKESAIFNKEYLNRWLEMMSIDEREWFISEKHESLRRSNSVSHWNRVENWAKEFILMHSKKMQGVMLVNHTEIFTNSIEELKSLQSDTSEADAIKKIKKVLDNLKKVLNHESENQKTLEDNFFYEDFKENIKNSVGYLKDIIESLDHTVADIKILNKLSMKVSGDMIKTDIKILEALIENEKYKDN